jgi:hypothetical protein
MNDQLSTEQGGAARPEGSLTAQLQRPLHGGVQITSELSAVHLRPDPNGSIMVSKPFERAPFDDELTFKDKVLRAIFGKQPKPVSGFNLVPHIIVKDHGVVSRRVVTTAGVTQLANAFLNTFECELFNYHAAGTGVTAEAIGDTALVTEVETRVAGTQSSPSAGQYRSIGTVAMTATRTINEHGIFSQLALGGTLWDRSMFSGSPIGVVSGDSIQFTYTATFTAGG